MHPAQLRPLMTSLLWWSLSLLGWRHCLGDSSRHLIGKSSLYLASAWLFWLQSSWVPWEWSCRLLLRIIRASRQLLGRILFLSWKGGEIHCRFWCTASLLHIVVSRADAASSEFFWRFMLESCKRLCKVSWHVYLGFSVFVVPLNCESDVFLCFLVHRHWIIFLDCVF